MSRSSPGAGTLLPRGYGAVSGEGHRAALRGSMIRGAFGRAFKESCCPFPQTAKVTRSERCPYAYDFETSPPENAREFSVADGARVVL